MTPCDGGRYSGFAGERNQRGMKKHRKRSTADSVNSLIEMPGGATAAFSFGDPEPVQNARILDYLGVFPAMGGEYYIPPVDLSGLSAMRRANGHHGSCILFRRNMLANAYRGGGLSVGDFRKAATDLFTFGNIYLQAGYNALRQMKSLKHVPGLNMRPKTDNRTFRMLLPNGQYTDFQEGEILHIKEYDTQQQIYGMPDWIGGLQSALLNQDATLFRRKYFVNGAHLGYILYTSDPKMNPGLVTALQEKVRQGKGVGNFKSLHVHIPNGTEKAFQIIPIGDISQKDEFLNIKNVSANDVRIAHRVPPLLMGEAPQGNGNLGDPEKIERVYIRTEVQAVAQNFIDLNDILPPKLQFKFDFSAPDAGAASGSGV